MGFLATVISFMTGSTGAPCDGNARLTDTHAQIERLATVFVTRDRLTRWLDQFESADRPTALHLLSQIKLYGYFETVRALSELHQSLAQRLSADGFDESQVDYTKAFTARSGDLIAFLYRRVNRVPSARITPSELLGTKAADASAKALVVLDDYAGTGAQSLIEYYGKAFSTEFNRYRKIYFAVIAANSHAIANFRDVKRGHGAEVAARLSRAFALAGDNERRFVAGMAHVDPAKIELVYVHEDQPLRERADQATRAFLLKYADFANSTTAPWGVAGISSMIAFFYGPPNGAPDVLWNTRGMIGEQPMLPLFQRIEDVSHYDFAAGLSAEELVWGGR